MVLKTLSCFLAFVSAIFVGVQLNGQLGSTIDSKNNRQSTLDPKTILAEPPLELAWLDQQPDLE
ncbi:MAG: hypothetical protein MUF23_11905 [Pirellula sp.]|jgi:hypothetical protein|nr:hypothetical protein [Pirellula sp.]